MSGASQDRVRSLVVRSLGLVSAIAFASLLVQIEGLVGSHGILPVTRAIPENFWDAPSVVWLWPSDGVLWGVCLAGLLLGLLVASGRVIAGPLLLVLWVLYLSISHAGQVFLRFQWDTLLCETLFVTLFYARWNPWEERPPSPFGRWLLRWTLFKLMLGSGLAKVASGDPTWLDGTALAYHYQTQPLPNPLSWYAHHLPASWHRLETWATLLIELPIPFLIFAGKTGRKIAFTAFTLLLGALFLTGNYGFFQLLSMVLVFSLLDDPRAPHPPRRPWVNAPIALVLALFVALGTLMQYGRLARHYPSSTLPLVRAIYPFRTVNAYGLFARMTRHRPELIVEGSDDGVTWRPYVFRYKPGPLERRPPVVAPHMPRVDWQLWFAALGRCERNPWFLHLLERLREGEPAVTRLLVEIPFPEGARYIRSRRVEYVFTETGPRTWATRGTPKRYCPILPSP